MDVLLSKGTALKRRASLSLRFGSQKPTFAARHGEPPRYYKFVDTPGYFRSSSPLIDRQELSPDLESQVNYACSLLVYRVEQGVPSPPINPASQGEKQECPSGDITATSKPQLAAKYISPKVCPEAAALETKCDSGVGLTQQPSLQTMRILHSRCSEPSDTENSRTTSLFSTARAGTSCSNSTVGNSPEFSDALTHPSVQSPTRKNEMQSLTGVGALGCAKQQSHEHETRVFLSESSNSESERTPADDSTSEDVDVFLTPLTSIETNSISTSPSSRTLHSNTSPSLGISREPTSTWQSALSTSKPPPPQSNPTNLGTYTLNNDDNTQRHHRSVIIDRTGCARILTAAEETQRNIYLQNAVMAKMTSGIAPRDPVRVSTQFATGRRVPSYNDNNNNRNDDTGTTRPQTGASRFLSSSCFKSTAQKQKGQSSSGSSVFRKFVARCTGRKKFSSVGKGDLDS